MGTNVKSVCPGRLHEITKEQKFSNIVASMNSTVIYSYLSRKWIRICHQKKVSRVSHNVNITLTFTFGGNWLRCKYKTSSVASSTVQHVNSIRVAWQTNGHKSAKFEISPVWSQMNPGLLYTIIIYSSWLIYCSDLYSYLIPINSMEQSPFWQTNSSSGSWDVCHMLWNSKVHYHIDNRPPFLPVLRQLTQSIFTTLKTSNPILFTIIPLILCYKYLTSICLMLMPSKISKLSPGCISC